MNAIEEAHQNMVSTLSKDPSKIRETLTPENWGLLMEACRRFIEASQYLDQVKKVVVYNKGGEIVPRAPVQVPNLSDKMIHLLHMNIGICGESGELLEAWFNALRNIGWDHDNQTEELGDLEFYLRGYYEGSGILRVNAMAHNLNKLIGGQSARYKDGEYSDEAAQARADKNGKGQ